MKISTQQVIPYGVFSCADTRAHDEMDEGNMEAEKRNESKLKHSVVVESRSTKTFEQSNAYKK